MFKIALRCQRNVEYADCVGIYKMQKIDILIFFRIFYKWKRKKNVLDYFSRLVSWSYFMEYQPL